MPNGASPYSSLNDLRFCKKPGYANKAKVNVVVELLKPPV
ncbi:hypothetical protein PC116_g30728 [Phytophthora cactorum]|nr:hypothetical protein PC116_g30728 [Phytophthora cactorum]